MKWQKHEIEIIKNNYKNYSDEELQKLLPGRNIFSIRIKAHRLRVTKPYERRDKDFSESMSLLGEFSEYEKGYIAGIIDGEGCINFARTKSKNGRRDYVYRLRVQIANTNFKLIEWLNERLGTHSYYTSNSIQPNRKQCYLWVLSGSRKTIRFLKEVKDLLILKKEQAELLSGGYLHLNDEERNVLFEKLRFLNKKGLL